MIIINRVYKALEQDLKLIYFLKIKDYYLFFVLGTSDYIYTVKVKKSFQSCNCEDFSNGFFCKHINFILFKFLKIFKIMKNNEIKFIFNNSLRDTNFFQTLEFDELEWSKIYTKFSNINYFLKVSNFDKKLFEKFKNTHIRYTNFFHTFKSKVERNCVICLNNDFNLILCPRCKNSYHQECLIKWFETLNHDKLCPICNDNSWKEIIKYILLDSEHMFKVDYL